MTIRVLFWSYFREFTGLESVDLDLPTGATVADALTEVYRRWPDLERMRGSTLFAVDVDYAEVGRVLRAGDELSLFPPVQGG